MWSFVLTLDGLGIVDVSELGNPELEGFLRLDLGQYPVSDLAVSGDDAYITTPENGMHVISVADPTAPVEVGFYDTDGEEWAVEAWNDHVFVACGDAGLYILRAIQGP